MGASPARLPSWLKLATRHQPCRRASGEDGSCRASVVHTEYTYYRYRYRVHPSYSFAHASSVPSLALSSVSVASNAEVFRGAEQSTGRSTDRPATHQSDIAGPTVFAQETLCQEQEEQKNRRPWQQVRAPACPLSMMRSRSGRDEQTGPCMPRMTVSQRRKPVLSHGTELYRAPLSLHGPTLVPTSVRRMNHHMCVTLAKHVCTYSSKTWCSFPRVKGSHPAHFRACQSYHGCIVGSEPWPEQISLMRKERRTGAPRHIRPTFPNLSRLPGVNSLRRAAARLFIASGCDFA